MTKKTVGIVGLGRMGNGMAQSLLRKGFNVVGTDIGEAPRQAAREIGVNVVVDINALCAEAGVIILSLPMAKHVQAVVKGEGGIIDHAQPNTLIIDTSTSEPEVTRALSIELGQLGHQLLDCPVSGGPAGAAAGTMVMVVGGKRSSLERAQLYLDALSSDVVYMGKSGNGHAAKLINNLLCAAHLVSTAEAVALGTKAGLDPADLIAGLNAGSGRSAVSEVNFPRWILNKGFDSGFTMQLMRKDVRLAQNMISEMGLELPLAEQVAEIWSQSEESIPDQADFNCIVKHAGLGE
ncbi:NAD(P)-dependent oxidoreductase [Marinobacter sp. X15-166B]|uniref:NAD(P)-dependent oxidoreductase n=1 Tax=Marinobacter sp. X15-166B TaxID=1897620 RepID=UPI00085BF97A|nr:NAD(P)-dependent oxidoreductase [Marinobacter sp. X15-166B]OEY68083.1 3-hydroxyisobutyrate dehydrogenase [Marinobacter sp. X15-166B]